MENSLQDAESITDLIKLHFFLRARLLDKSTTPLLHVADRYSACCECLRRVRDVLRHSLGCTMPPCYDYTGILFHYCTGGSKKSGFGRAYSIKSGLVMGEEEQ